MILELILQDQRDNLAYLISIKCKQIHYKDASEIRSSEMPNKETKVLHVDQMTDSRQRNLPSKPE